MSSVSSRKKSLTEQANLLATRLWQPQQYANVYGKCDERFANIKDAFARIQPAKTVGGGALTVFYEGKPVIDIYAGSRDKVGCELFPWQEDTMVLSYSCGKAVAATLVHVLVSDGVLNYDVPIAAYWKAFGQNGKEHITLRHVLCHESGLFNIRDITSTASDMLDWEGMLARIETMRPEFTEGSDIAYQACTFGWIVGGVIEKATGEPFTQVLVDKLLKPLGIENDVFFGVPDIELHRVARVIDRKIYDPELAAKLAAKKKPLSTKVFELGVKAYMDIKGVNETYFTQSISPKDIDQLDFSGDDVIQCCAPAFNGVFTTHAMATMYAMLANGGEWNGKRLISTAVLDAATRLQNDSTDHVFMSAVRWRLGYHKVFTLTKPALTAFGHSGYNGSMSFCDPTRQLAFSYTHNFKNVWLATDYRVHYLSQQVLHAVDKLRG